MVLNFTKVQETKATMNSIQLANEIERLPLWDKITLIEQVLQSIKKEALPQSNWAEAAQEMRSFYEQDTELTAFTALDDSLKLKPQRNENPTSVLNARRVQETKKQVNFVKFRTLRKLSNNETKRLTKF